jgi:hypothetical protein
VVTLNFLAVPGLKNKSLLTLLRTCNLPNNPDSKPNHKDNIWNINSKEQNIDVGTEQKILPGNLEKAVFTRLSHPFKVERVNAVLAELTIGDDLTKEQRVSIDNLLREFADCFALSMSKVTVVEGATHKLNIPEGTTFKKKGKSASTQRASKRVFQWSAGQNVRGRYNCPN